MMQAVLNLSPPERGRLRSSRVRGMEKFRAKAKLLRSKQTSAEARLWRALRNRSLERWKFRRQHPIDRYVVDFVTLDGKLVVEVDGVTHDSEHERRYDRERTSALEACGFLVIRVSNSDVYDNLDGVLELIRTTLPQA
jgi:very-short-patch-repair endonuclease